jgi:hypothetical protein
MVAGINAHFKARYWGTNCIITTTQSTIVQKSRPKIIVLPWAESGLGPFHERSIDAEQDLTPSRHPIATDFLVVVVQTRTAIKQSE